MSGAKHPTTPQIRAHHNNHYTVLNFYQNKSAIIFIVPWRESYQLSAISYQPEKKFTVDSSQLKNRFSPPQNSAEHEF
jgi:hypothetical protein